jgi:predicted deacylase
VAAAVVAVALPAGDAATGPLDTTVTTVAAPALVGESIGASVQGRSIELFSVGSGPRRVLVVGGVHGDETGGAVARQLLAYLEDHPEAVPAGVFIAVVPSANPDGEAAGTRANANGVDINRNFPSDNWAGVLSEGDRPTDGLTGGAGPASEPETQALVSCLADDYDLVISLHSQGGIIDFDGEGGRAIAEHMSAVSGLPVQHLDYQEYVTGSLGIYVPEAYGVPVITVELEDSVLSPGLRDALLTAGTLADDG